MNFLLSTRDQDDNLREVQRDLFIHAFFNLEYKYRLRKIEVYHSQSQQQFLSFSVPKQSRHNLYT